MKLFKKIMSTFAAAAFAIVVAACANPVIVKAGAVNIKEITAQKYELNKEDVPARAKYAAAPTMQRATDIAIAHAEGEGSNYILIYKDEHNIELTVTLDNPKGESIDALEISCDDPDAKILVDGEYKAMNVTANGRVINWAQEDPYQKTFYMQTVADSSMNTVRVNDVKVNGAWQQGTLTNNELSIYKITKDNLDAKFIANTPEYYEVEFIVGENVSNLEVNCDHGQWISTSHYRVTENCELSWTFEYTFGSTVRTWSESRDIELLKIGKDNPIDEIIIIYNALDENELDADAYLEIYNIAITGTNINNIEFSVIYNNGDSTIVDYTPRKTDGTNIWFGQLIGRTPSKTGRPTTLYANNIAVYNF